MFLLADKVINIRDKSKIRKKNLRNKNKRAVTLNKNFQKVLIRLLFIEIIENF